MKKLVIFYLKLDTLILKLLKHYIYMSNMSLLTSTYDTLKSDFIKLLYRHIIVNHKIIYMIFTYRLSKNNLRRIFKLLDHIIQQ